MAPLLCQLIFSLHGHLPRVAAAELLAKVGNEKPECLEHSIVAVACAVYHRDRHDKWNMKRTYLL